MPTHYNSDPFSLKLPVRILNFSPVIFSELTQKGYIGIGGVLPKKWLWKAHGLRLKSHACTCSTMSVVLSKGSY